MKNVLITGGSRGIGRLVYMNFQITVTECF